MTNSLFWVSIQQAVTIGIQSLSTIILARFLHPQDYALLGMMILFISISNMLVDSGMGGALIKKENVTKTDYSTLFHYNLVISIFLYILIFFLAPLISTFYNQDILIALIRVLAISIIINALSIVQYIQLVRCLNFKRIAIISFIANTLSLLIAIWLAWKGYGVWALIMQQLVMTFLNTLLLFFWNKFIPNISFSYKSFKEQFSFGINLLASNFLSTISANLNSNVVTKIATPVVAGNYVQAYKLQSYPVSIVTSIIDKTVFPIYSRIKKIDELRIEYDLLTRRTYLLMFPFFFFLIYFSKELVNLLLGSQWLEATWMFKELIYSFMPMLVQVLCRNIFKSLGKTKLIFRIEIFKTVISLGILFISAFFGIKFIIIGYLLSQIINAFVMMVILEKSISYKLKDQIKSIFIPFIIAFIPYILVKLIIPVFVVDGYLYITISLISYILILVLFSFLFKQENIFSLLFQILKKSIQERGIK